MTYFKRSVWLGVITSDLGFRGRWDRISTARVDRDDGTVEVGGKHEVIQEYDLLDRVLGRAEVGNVTAEWPMIRTSGPGP